MATTTFTRRQLAKLSRKKLVKLWHFHFGEEPLPMMEPADMLHRGELIGGILNAQETARARKTKHKKKEHRPHKEGDRVYVMAYSEKDFLPTIYVGRILDVGLEQGDELTIRLQCDSANIVKNYGCYDDDEDEEPRKGKKKRKPVFENIKVDEAWVFRRPQFAIRAALEECWTKMQHHISRQRLLLKMLDDVPSISQPRK